MPDPKSIKVMLTVGNKVVYPSRGPCIVGAIVQKMIGDLPVTFYQLRVLDDGGGDVFIPVDKVNSVGIRQLLRKTDIPQLLNRLGERTQAADDHRQRASDNSKLLASGSPFGLAQIVESLTELGETKALSSNDRKVLERARRLLVCEMSEVIGVTKEEAEGRLDQAVSAGRRQASTVAG
ncbi:MAG TPA: CarD family transcriptional regulator [Blastocatellia bacterium]|jgi:CarD family transcriptional regulator|nr:CarD family transcriptional regulator [Blastocatellia bacterium]